MTVRPVFIYLRYTPRGIRMYPTHDLVFTGQKINLLADKFTGAYQAAHLVVDELMAHVRETRDVRPYFGKELLARLSAVVPRHAGYARVEFIEATAQRQRRLVLVPIT